MLKQTLSPNYFFSKKGLLGLFWIIVYLLSAQLARAQNNDNPWSTPENISQSGSATAPEMVIDETGVVHVFWSDEYAGYFYRSGDDDSWNERVRVNPPFAPHRPTLVLGKNNLVLAFWIDESNNLLLSQALAEQLGSGWETPGWMASSVVDFGVEVDTQGVIHISYVYMEDEGGLAGGVHYRRSTSNGDNWSEPLDLYQSPYLRGLEGENANVQLASTELAEGNLIFAGWDNRVRKQIYLARSLDDGITWEDPILVDGPDSADPNMVPSNLRIAVFGENVLLVWNRGVPEGGCSVYYRWSQDGGDTWSERYRMSGDFQGCPGDINFIEGGENQVLLYETFPFQVIFRAWDGSKWSNPQLQTQLFSFEDPETFRVIDFECLRFASNHSKETLTVIGCDNNGGDVWYSERNLGNTTTWYPPPPIWTDPVEVSLAGSETGPPILVGGQDEMMHAFWIQPGVGDNTSSANSRIYYARWDGETWSRQSNILGSPEGNASQPYATLDQNNHLLAAWTGSDPNLVYFSKSSASLALRGSDWTHPQAIPVPVPAAKSPQILPVGSSLIHIIYAIPLNEARGIYLVSSDDSGNTWSQPLRIFDAVNAGWEMVDSPFLARADDGSLHVIFTRYSLPGGSGPMEMYYTHSRDGGDTWSQPEIVDDNPVYWGRIVSGKDGVLHRIWQARTSVGSGFVIEHQYSPDMGFSWSQPESISNWGLSDPTVMSSLAVSSTQVLHLLYTIQGTTGEFYLHHWVWVGDQWERREDLKLDMNQFTKLTSLSAAASPTGRVAALFTVQTATESLPSITENALLFSIRALDISIPPSAPQPVILPSPTPTPGPTPETTLVPTPALDLSLIGNDASSSPPISTTTGVAIGLSLAFILVGIMFGFGVRSIRGKK